MDHELFYLFQIAFTIWMLVEIYRRQDDAYWYYVVLFLPIVGPLAYFIVVKRHDISLPSKWFGPRKPSLEELRFQAQQAPTLARDLALAEALVERHQH